MKNRFAVDGIPQSLKNGFEAYREYALAKGVSPRTVQTVRTDAFKLFLYMQKNDLKGLKDLSEKILMKFQIWLRTAKRTSPTGPDKKMTAGTRAKVIANLRSFLAWAYKTGRIQASLSQSLIIPKTPKSLPKYIPSLDEISQLLRYEYRNPKPTPESFRNAAMIALFFASGIRRQALADLSMDDINLNDREVYIRSGKGKKGRIVFFTPWARTVLRAYLKNSRPNLENEYSENRLFLRSIGKPFKGKDIGKIFERICKEALLENPITPHSLRHAFCLYLLKGGASIRVVNALAGHKSLSVTARYTRIDISDLKQAVAETHPRSNETVNKTN